MNHRSWNLRGCGAVILSTSKRFHMARSERRGYRTSRSPGLLRFASRRMAVMRGLFAFVVLLVLCRFGVAQDVNVHIEPRSKTDPAKADSAKTDSNTAAKAPDAPDKDVPGKGTTSTTESAFKQRGMIVPVDLVLVNVTVTDDWNRIVTGLEKENFAVMEGNEIQMVKHFSSEDAPISLAVIFDMTATMSHKI